MTSDDPITPMVFVRLPLCVAVNLAGARAFDPEVAERMFADAREAAREAALRIREALTGAGKTQSPAAMAGAPEGLRTQAFSRDEVVRAAGVSLQLLAGVLGHLDDWGALTPRKVATILSPLVKVVDARKPMDAPLEPESLAAMTALSSLVDLLSEAGDDALKSYSPWRLAVYLNMLDEMFELGTRRKNAKSAP
ncbi:MAG: hypothetical protein HC900_13050 [Methylacidiphilales bacterium]|nr:hypothetical protein [Candidatus Methylacidiphilales bacterium]